MDASTRLALELNRCSGWIASLFWLGLFFASMPRAASTDIARHLYQQFPQASHDWRRIVNSDVVVLGRPAVAWSPRSWNAISAREEIKISLRVERILFDPDHLLANKAFAKIRVAPELISDPTKQFCFFLRVTDPPPEMLLGRVIPNKDVEFVPADLGVEEDNAESVVAASQARVALIEKAIHQVDEDLSRDLSKTSVPVEIANSLDRWFDRFASAESISIEVQTKSGEWVKAVLDKLEAVPDFERSSPRRAVTVSVNGFKSKISSSAQLADILLQELTGELFRIGARDHSRLSLGRARRAWRVYWFREGNQLPTTKVECKCPSCVRPHY